MLNTFTSHSPVFARVAGDALDAVARIRIGAVDATVEQNDQAP
jgi:hypothetical protein